MSLGDRWLGRTARIVALAGAVVASYGVFAQAMSVASMARADHAAVDSLRARVGKSEAAMAAVSYMTCVNFAETHPIGQVPAYCNEQTR